MIIVDKRGCQRPFSRGLLAQSIAGTGLPLERTYELALEIYGALEVDGRESIASSELEELVCSTLIDHGLSKEQRFYKVHRRLRQLSKPLMILVGGATGVGKSALSSELGHRLGITMVVSTDTVREIMRTMISPSLAPTLHESTFMADEGLRRSYVADQLIHAFDQQVSMVCSGVHAVMERGIKEGVDMVLNGVHLVPGYVEVARFARDAHLFFYVLALEHVEEHERRFERRSEHSRREAAKYIARIDKIRTIQTMIVDRAVEDGVAVLREPSLEDGVIRIIRDVFTTLEEEILS